MQHVVSGQQGEDTGAPSDQPSTAQHPAPVAGPSGATAPGSREASPTPEFDAESDDGTQDSNTHNQMRQMQRLFRGQLREQQEEFRLHLQQQLREQQEDFKLHMHQQLQGQREEHRQQLEQQSLDLQQRLREQREEHRQQLEHQSVHLQNRLQEQQDEHRLQLERQSQERDADVRVLREQMSTIEVNDSPAPAASPAPLHDMSSTVLASQGSHGQHDVALAVASALTSHHLCKRPGAFSMATPKRPAAKFLKDYVAYIEKLCPGNPQALCLHISDFLEGRALYWYEDKIRGTPAQEDFSLLREHLLTRFKKVDPELMDVQYQTRRQGETEGVSAYTSDMEALLSYSGLNQKGRVNYYISGLRPDIASLIRPKDPDTLQEAESLAREIERNLVAYSGSRRANEQDLLQTIREVTVASISEALGQYRHQADDEICALTPPTGPPHQHQLGHHQYQNGHGYHPRYRQDRYSDEWQWRPQRGHAAWPHGGHGARRGASQHCGRGRPVNNDNNNDNAGT